MSDWIEWNGGECPVDDGTMVYVMFKGKHEGSKNPEGAHLFRWSHDCNCGDIIAYRLAEPVPDKIIRPAIVSESARPDMVNNPPHYTAARALEMRW